MAENNERLDSAVLILLLTALAYGIAFAYEVAYLSHFGIPAAFAEVNLRSALLFGAGSVYIVMMIAGVVDVFSTRGPVTAIKRIVRRDTYVFVAVCVLVSMLGLPAGRVRWVLISFGLIGFVVDFGLPLFGDKTITYIERLRARAERKIVHVKEVGAVELAERKLGWVVRPAIILLASAVLIGNREAVIARHYFVTADGCVVLRVQADSLLCAAIKDKKLTGAYAYLPAQGTAMTRQRIGPLARFKTDESKSTR